MATALNHRLRDGIAAAKARQFDRARAMLEPVVAANPGELVAWFWLAIAAKSADEAISCLRRVLEIDPEHPQAREALAKLLVTQAGAAAAAGHPNEACAWAREATQLTPASDAAWLVLASASTDRVERIHALRRAFELNPQAATRSRLRQALLYHAMLVASNDRAGARSLFREAVGLEPSDVRVWHALVQLADSPGDALEIVREFVSAVPAHPAGTVWLTKALAADARALDGAGLADEACIRWREVVEIDPRNVDGWLGLAQSTPDEDEAKHAIEAAFEIDPTDERVSAAMLDLQDVALDETAFEAPADAFDRLGEQTDVFGALDATPDPFAQFELAADPFARFAPPEPPVAAQPDAAPVVDSPSEPPAIAAVPDLTPEVDTPALEVVAPEAFDIEPAPEPPIVVVPVAEVVPEPWLVTSEPLMATPEPPLAVVEPPAVEDVEVAPVPIDAAAAIAPPAHVEAVAPAPAPIALTSPVAAPPVSAVPDVRREPNGRRTVMVVDDSPTIRKILGLTLERAGYKVVAEPDGESAVERLMQVVPDVILLDIAMPKLDGYEVCKRIKKDPRTAHVPVVMLSGKDAFFDKVKGHMAGATEYLTKPFETPAVLAAVSNACNPTQEAVNG